jgi:hypothetical protein
MKTSNKNIDEIKCNRSPKGAKTINNRPQLSNSFLF